MEVVVQRCSVKEVSNFAGKHLYHSLFFKKESLAQVFSCEFCKISKNIFFHRTPLMAASAYKNKKVSRPFYHKNIFDRKLKYFL